MGNSQRWPSSQGRPSPLQGNHPILTLGPEHFRLKSIKMLTLIILTIAIRLDHLALSFISPDFIAACPDRRYRRTNKEQRKHHRKYLFHVSPRVMVFGMNLLTLP